MPDDYKHIIRISNVDIEGDKSISQGLQRIKGIGHMFSNAICNNLNIDKGLKIGSLSSEQVKRIESEISNPSFPDWLLNRRKDIETGENKHLTGASLKLQGEFDFKRLQRIKSYRGLRRSQGLPVRGQRTKSNFRHGKTVGVQRKGIKTVKSQKQKAKQDQGKKK